MKKVLEAMVKTNLRIKLKKCKFYKKEVDFLGVIIERYGLCMDLKKISVVTEWPTPILIKEI